jgi:hypothetical protein
VCEWDTGTDKALLAAHYPTVPVSQCSYKSICRRTYKYGNAEDAPGQRDTVTRRAPTMAVKDVLPASRGNATLRAKQAMRRAACRHPQFAVLLVWQS